jgi:hypothetical protein
MYYPAVGKTPVRKVPFKMLKVTKGTHPQGSEWARNPVPGCKKCPEVYHKCGGKMKPIASGGLQQGACFNNCDEGHTCATPQFPEPVPKLSGFIGNQGAWTWSVMDQVLIPQDLTPGPYLLSWRWDCEESNQIW